MRINSYFSKVLLYTGLVLPALISCHEVTVDGNAVIVDAVPHAGDNSLMRRAEQHSDDFTPKQQQEVRDIVRHVISDMSVPTAKNSLQSLVSTGQDQKMPGMADVMSAIHSGFTSDHTILQQSEAHMAVVESADTVLQNEVKKLFDDVDSIKTDVAGVKGELKAVKDELAVKEDGAKVQTALEALKTKVEDVHKQVTKVKNQETNIQVTENSIKSSVSEVKTEESATQTGVTAVKDELNTVKSVQFTEQDGNQMKDDLGKIKTDMSTVKEHVKEVKDDLSVKEDGSKIKKELTLIANEVIPSEVVNPPESSRTYSSVWGNPWWWKRGWLDSRSGWLKSGHDHHPWMKIDLGKEYCVTGVVTQGYAYHHHWVKFYKLQTSKNGNDWTDAAGTFEGGKNYGMRKVESIPAIKARYVKILPQKGRHHWIMRAAVMAKPEEDCS